VRSPRKAAIAWLGAALFSQCYAPAIAGTARAPYEVLYKGSVVATQTVIFENSGELTTIKTSFAATLPVFVSTHHYEEDLAVTFNDAGDVISIRSRSVDGGRVLEVTADLADGGDLDIQISGPEGVTNRSLARADYDFNSLALYGVSPDVFLPINQPARVLDVSTGEVISQSISIISESTTFERQHLPTKHLIWTEGVHTSHSWHPEKYNNFPSRYIRQTGAGEFVFRLVR
jgi:hypothetical protein